MLCGPLGQRAIGELDQPIESLPIDSLASPMDELEMNLNVEGYFHLFLIGFHRSHEGNLQT
jgi:hypothetical protein